MSENYKKLYNFDTLDGLIFETAQQAQDYAKKNPGSTITRNSQGNGYILKIQKNHLPSDNNYELYLDTNLLKNISGISESILNEILIYIDIYYSNNFKELYEVNDYISHNNIWYKFINIKSYNKYSNSNGYRVGASPEYYPIISKLINIENKATSRLEDSKKILQEEALVTTAE